MTVRNILTRTSGYLSGVTSHSLQPYRGCTLGRALCGVGCYVQHNAHVLKGRPWGGFLEVRDNAAESYLEHAPRERKWAHRRGSEFSIFCSSATDPFLPQERRYQITARLLESMLKEPPDLLLLQTHSHRAQDALATLVELNQRCRLRVHVSIESDRDRLPGLPPPASSVRQRLAACGTLREAGLFVAVTVAPLLPIDDPQSFFRRVSDMADAVVIDHFIGGDGSRGGTRTLQTALPAAMERVDPASLTLEYRDRIVAIAREIMPGRVGVHADGFAGRYA